MSEALRFLVSAQAKAVAPFNSNLSTTKWNVATLRREDTVFPCAVLDSPAALPMLLTGREHSIPIEHWADGSDRDNVKFWAGAAGYPGAALARDALDLVRDLGDNELAVAAADPFSVSAPQSSSFRFDWRRDYIPLEVGFSPNEHGNIADGRVSVRRIACGNRDAERSAGTDRGPQQTRLSLRRVERHVAHRVCARCAWWPKASDFPFACSACDLAGPVRKVRRAALLMLRRSSEHDRTRCRYRRRHPFMGR